MMSPSYTEHASSPAVRRPISPHEILESAAHSLILARCRQAYAHELHSGLHPIFLAVELLGRAASVAAKNPGLLEQSSALAKRAMSIHEKSTVELFKQITIADELPSVVNMGAMLDEILRLLRTDLERKAIAFKFTNSPDVVVQARAYTLRLLLLGLIAMTIDELSEATDLSLVLMRAEGGALIEMQANIDFPPIDMPEMLLTSGVADSLTPCALVLAAARQWFTANGGGLELGQSSPVAMRIHYPLGSRQPGPTCSPSIGSRDAESPGANIDVP